MKNDKNSMQLFMDGLLGAQQAGREGAFKDAIDNILKAKDSSISKRKLLGIDKNRSSGTGDNPLFDTVDKPKTLF